MTGRGPRQWLGLLARGMAMGIAEVVPGVSGGTIAFITGIYHELVRTLAAFGPSSVEQIVTRGPVVFWRSHNLGFLTVLALGMALGIGLFARLMAFWLEVAAPVVWGFFFGLIALSVVHVGRGRPLRYLVGFGAAGCAAALALGQLDPLDGSDALWVFFLGGMVAVSAWMLPAISGSFMLLMLGLYQPVLVALNAWQWPVLASLAAGCLAGLAAFSKLLAWLLGRFQEPLMATLTGFMAGSVVRLWPWRLDGAAVSPDQFAAAGEPALLPATCLAVAAGGASVWLLSRLE